MIADTKTDAFSGGFRQPVFDAQGVFRVVLDALARPGKIMPLAPRTKPPKPMPALVADILCALADQETPVLLCPPLAKTPTVAGWLRFQTGAPSTAIAADATFVAAPAPDALPPLSQLAAGTADYPDRSATVLVAVESLERGRPVTLSGPGIKGHRPFAPAGVPLVLWQQLQANHMLYPRGIDVIFASASAIAGLPRSTAIEIGEG